MTHLGGIYEIRNLNSGVRYIGSAQNIGVRLKQHRAMLARGKHHSIALQRAWEKHGDGSFVMRPVAILEPSELLSTEQRFIDAEHSGETYNIAKDAVAWMKGRKHTPEWLAAHSERMKGNPSRTGVPSHWKGKTLSDEHKAKLKSAKAVITAETRQKMRDAKVGVPPNNKGARNLVCKQGHEKVINSHGKGVCRTCRCIQQLKYTERKRGT